MKMHIHQLGAMLRYELLMQWRRRGMAVVILTFTVASVVFLVGVQQVGGLLTAVNRDFLNAVSFGILPAILQLICAVPLIAGESFPLDRQTRMTEVLNGLPLPGAVYITGKLLSTCTAVLIGIVFSALVLGLGGWLLFGAFDILSYALLWLYTILPTMLFVTAIGTLLATACSTRRQAALVGLVCIPWTVVIYVYGLVTHGFVPPQFWLTAAFLTAQVGVVWLGAWLRQSEGV